MTLCPSGVLIVDKPEGPTSHDVVARVRRALHADRAGHTGTLDPMATGVLPLLLGHATRLARFLNADRKTYTARVRLGVSTDTYDATGQPSEAPSRVPHFSREAVDKALDAFRGTFEQRPPPFSAKRVGGRRSYALARRGNAMPLEPVVVTVEDLALTGAGDDWLELSVTASAGFYVRSLAHDIGERLGCGAHLSALRRTVVGQFNLSDALPLDAVERDPAWAMSRMVPTAAALPHLAAVELTQRGLERAAHGNHLGAADVVAAPIRHTGDRPGYVRLLDDRGELVAVAEPSARGALLHPVVVLR